MKQYLHEHHQGLNLLIHNLNIRFVHIDDERIPPEGSFLDPSFSSGLREHFS